MTNEQAAYVAAAIDGEGYLGLVPVGRFRQGRAAPGFSFRIRISNTDKPWLEVIQGWVGGYIEPSTSKGNRKPCFNLRFNGHDARQLLVRVMPYLILKRARAELVLRYFDVAAKRRSNNRPGTPSDPLVVQELLQIHADLKRLNQRGICDTNYAGPPQTTRLCSIDGCGGKHYSSGYCRSHYRRYVEHGGFKLYEKRCVVCRRVFTARRTDTETCSKPCSDRNQYLKNHDAKNAYKRAWRAKQRAIKP